MKPVAFVYRDQEQIMQVYINEFEEEELDRLEEEGMLFFAEYPGGHFRRVSRGEVVTGSCYPAIREPSVFIRRRMQEHETDKRRDRTILS